jgi:hypothetical protein
MFHDSILAPARQHSNLGSEAVTAHPQKGNEATAVGIDVEFPIFADFSQPG